MGVVDDVLAEVRSNLRDIQFSEHDVERVVFWSWCTIHEYNVVLVREYGFTPKQLAEHTEDHADATHVMTVIFEGTVGREADEPYEYIDLVDGDHWFVAVDGDEFEVVEMNDGSQPEYYGGPREAGGTETGARQWVAKFGTVNECVYASDSDSE